MAAIESCRTAALGGHLYYCTKCERNCYSYHSCKSRYCPQCQNQLADEWLAKQPQLLLKIPHFLVTFTIPAELRALARSHQKTVYNILMRTSAQALLTLTANPKYLGGMVGIISVLQTWTRDLRYHPHVHMLVSGGCLWQDGQSWLSLRYPYLVPQKALAKVFAGKFHHALKKAGLSKGIPARIWKQSWVVDLLAVGSGETALRYLAPYIFRVAISNRRILGLDQGKVKFQFKDSKTGEQNIAVLPALHFIHRFLQHVLPHRFMKVRTYGLFSPKHRHLMQKAKCLVGGVVTEASGTHNSPPITRVHLFVHIVKRRCNILESFPESKSPPQAGHHELPTRLFLFGPSFCKALVALLRHPSILPLQNHSKKPGNSFSASFPFPRSIRWLRELHPTISHNHSSTHTANSISTTLSSTRTCVAALFIPLNHLLPQISQTHRSHAHSSAPHEVLLR